MHLRGRRKHIALRLCLIQRFLQDGILNVKRCPTVVQTADVGTRLCLSYLLENLANQLFGDKHVGDK